MAECTDNNYRKLLPLYELNLLPEEERLRFELHLYECTACLEEVQGFSNTSRIINYDSEIREIVAAEDDVHNNGKQKIISKEPFLKKFRYSLIPSVIVTAVLLIIMILKPWHLEISPTKEAIASENRLAIMYFGNITDRADPEKLGEIITSLLITDLAESKYMQVVSSQRLYDLLKLLGYEGMKQVDRVIATQVAQKADARYMLMGDIIEHENTTILQSQLILTATGDIVASQKIVGSPDNDLFGLVDSLTAAIKRDLSLPREALLETDRAVAELTTNSTIAYRLYLEAVDDYFKFYKEEALSKFEEVVEIDSSFAKAYYFLAGLKDKNLIYKALELNENGSRIDSYYFRIFQASIEQDIDLENSLLLELIEQYPDEKEAYFQLGRLKYYNKKYEEAIASYTEAIRIDSHYKGAYNQMVYTYNAMGNLEKALWAIDKYIEIAPDEANPYDTKGDLYAFNGMLENAIESYSKALLIKPDFYASLSKQGLLYLFAENYDKADSCFDIILSGEKNSYSDITSFYRVHIPFVQGRYGETIERIDSTLKAGGKEWSSYHFIKSQIFMELENWSAALLSFDSCLNEYLKSSPRDSLIYENYYIQLLAASGNFDKALNRAEQFKKFLLDRNHSLDDYFYSKGAIAMSQNDHDQAAIYFDSVETENVYFYSIYMKGRAYLSAGRIDDAVDVFEKAVKIYNSNRLFYAVWSADIHYYLGLAYESSGQIEKSIAEFEKFLSLWKNSDSGLIEKDIARTKLANLKNQP